MKWKLFETENKVGGWVRTQVPLSRECVPLHCSAVHVPIGFTGFAKAFPEIWKVLREFDHVEMRTAIELMVGGGH